MAKATTATAWKPESANRSGFDHQAYAENFDRIFNKHDKCGTDECCMTCDTAVTNTSQPVDSKQEKK